MDSVTVSGWGGGARVRVVGNGHQQCLATWPWPMAS